MRRTRNKKEKRVKTRLKIFVLIVCQIFQIPLQQIVQVSLYNIHGRPKQLYSQMNLR